MAFFDNIKFPFFTLQELNLDWLLAEVKRIAGFMPQDGNVGDILTRKSDGAEWEPPDAVQVNIDGLPEDTQIMDNDQLIFYDISAQANRKIKPPNMLDSMCSNGTPYMNGTGSAGTSKKPSRYDHVHPTDTSRQAALSGTQMNAVNSGAPASSFSSGKLKIVNGGTGADNAATARVNLGLCYAVNDSETFAGYGLSLPGVILSSATIIYIDVVLPRSLENISTITVTALTGVFKGVSGNLDNENYNVDYINDPNVTVTAVRTGNIGVIENTVRIKIEKTGGFTNVSNNTPICYYGSLNLQFT